MWLSKWPGRVFSTSSTEINPRSNSSSLPGITSYCMPIVVSIRRSLPEKIGRAKDRAVGARQAITPVAAGERRLRGIGFSHEDAARLTCAHAAGHRPLDRHL